MLNNNKQWFEFSVACNACGWIVKFCAPGSTNKVMIAEMLIITCPECGSQNFNTDSINEGEINNVKTQDKVPLMIYHNAYEAFRQWIIFDKHRQEAIKINV